MFYIFSTDVKTLDPGVKAELESESEGNFNSSEGGTAQLRPQQ